MLIAKTPHGKKILVAANVSVYTMLILVALTACDLAVWVTGSLDEYNSLSFNIFLGVITLLILSIAVVVCLERSTNACLESGDVIRLSDDEEPSGPS